MRVLTFLSVLFAIPTFASDFAAEVYPVLATRCFECHGTETQKSDLRLDSRESALAGGKSGVVVVPGKAAESRLVTLISGQDPDVHMPPKGAALTAAEIQRIREWIDAGAPWSDVKIAPEDIRQYAPDHWSFLPIASYRPPAVSKTGWVRNEIDRFVLARLEREGIAPSPEADPVTLMRRLYLDLLGLPPPPEDVDAYLADKSPYAYEALVNRLLASPHFGERWGRHWLDLARYADSDGFEKDTPRPNAWRYRQWVIEALNRDLPYDQFVIEQLAGDLLPNATIDQRVATGFHRNTLTNLEGGVDQEEFRVEQVIDRTNTTAAVFMGLTMACSQCHSHKYDPISQREYYGMFAFFNSGMEKDVPAPLEEETALYQRDLDDFNAKTAKVEREIREYAPQLKKKLTDMEASFRRELEGLRWTLLDPASMSSTGGAEFTKLEDGSILVGGTSAPVDTYTIEAQINVEGITAFRLEALTHESLPKNGPGRARHGNFILSEIHVTAMPLGGGDAVAVEFERATADHAEEGFPIEKAIDGDAGTGWSADAWRGLNEDRRALFITKNDVGFSGGAKLAFTFDHQYGSSHAIGRFRLYAASGSREDLDVSPEVLNVLAVPPFERTKDEEKALLDFFGKRDPEMRTLRAELDGLNAAKPEIKTLAQVLIENPTPPVTNVLVRGSFLNKGDAVKAHVPVALPAIQPRGEALDRLDLARWLVSSEHPLTARVAANRVWEHLFGRGIVETSEDFGTRGTPPSHPELLDWLATEYMKRGWSTKAMIKLVVTSATYRQASTIRTDLEDRDPQNLFLARQDRFRAEAEIVRDLSLAASGLLNPTIGGPSVRPPLPEGVRELGYANSIPWDADTGAEKYRRGLYIHFQRTVPFPMLMTFDCPNSNTTAIRRSRSDTPLQALTLLNDSTFFECAQALGARLAVETDKPIDARMREVFRACLAREPQPREIETLTALWNDQKSLFTQHPDAAKKLAGERQPPTVAPEDTAPWIIVARSLMNLDEFVTRE